jgi:hypothetical protein
MKKSIIALAVAGAMTVPMVAQADATLFGSVRYDITDTDGQTHVDSEVNRMRIGVKGEETMDSGLTAGYFVRLQAASADANTSVNVAKVALYISGDFGKIILGDADSPVQYAEGRQTYTAVYDGSLEVAGTEFGSGGISYESNVINGFQFRAGVGDIDGGDAAASADENAYGLGVAYGTDLFDIAVGLGEEADDTVWGVGAQVKLGDATIGAAISDVEDTVSYGSISGKYVIDKLTLAAQYEVRDFDATGANDWKAVNVSAKYDLGGNAAVSLGYIDFNSDAEVGGKADQLKLRYAISF